MFDFRRQADTLGNYVDRFQLLAKNLNNGMLRSPDTTGYIDAIIGAGRFNRAVMEIPAVGSVADKTVLYAEELRKARTQDEVKHHGLFAALAAIHHPLLGFAQNLLIDLGKHGFKCVVTHEGQEFSIPLHELKIDFDEDGRIFTASDIKSGGKTLPAHSLLLEGRSADPGLFLLSAKGHLHCRIEDSHNTPVDNNLLTQLLWTGVSGKGKNIYGAKGKKNDILALAGIDDMDDANRFLIDTVQALQTSHHYDPQTLWDRVMASARQQLTPHLESLAIVRESIEHSAKAGAFPNVMRSIPDPYNVKTIDNLMDFFGLSLPALEAGQKQTAEAISRGLAGVGRG